MEQRDLSSGYVIRQIVRHELGLLHTALTEIGFAQDTQAALRAVLRLISEECDWEMGEAWLPSQEESVLQRAAAWTRPASGSREKFRQSVSAIPIESNDVLSRVFKSRLAVWIHEPGSSQNDKDQHLTYLQPVHPVLAIPVLAGEDVIAVLQFFNEERRSEDEQLTIFLSTVAAQLGWTLRHKREQDALRAREEHYRNLFEKAPICIHEIDEQRNLTAINPAGARMLCWSQEQDIRGTSALEFVSAADRPRVEALLNRAFAG